MENNFINEITQRGFFHQCTDKDKLTNLLGGTKKDSTKTKSDTKDKVTGVLKGLFGKKKKKDTIN